MAPGAQMMSTFENAPAAVGASLSQLLRHEGNVGAMRAAQYREAQMRGLGPMWQYSNEFIDDAIVRVGREGLVVAADRIDQNPVSMPNWLSILELTSHKVGESRAAQRGMVPICEPMRDAVAEVGKPFPIPGPPAHPRCRCAVGIATGTERAAPTVPATRIASGSGGGGGRGR